MLFQSDSHVYEGATLNFNFGPLVLPFEYKGVKEEVLASKTSAWIGTQLMNSPIYDITGPDAVKFLNSICINDFSKLGPKGLRHAVICNEKGQILTDGVVHKTDEDTYRTYWLNPPVDYLLKKSGMDVTGTDVSHTDLFIQVAGEKSLEILEEALETDLHDIKFARHRTMMYEDMELRIIRLGMSGNLAYEIHGDIQYFEKVYQRVCEVGQKYGAEKLGMHAYSGPNHTEAGFPNILIHYPMPWFYSDPGLAEYLSQPENFALGVYNVNFKMVGSADDLQERFVTPYDVGWGFLVNNNHDFIGKEALLEIAKNPPRTCVTLEWNAEDVGAVFASQFMGEPEKVCEPIQRPVDMYYQDNMYQNPMKPGEGFKYHADKVMVKDEQIGISAGRTISYYSNTMISLAFIKPEFAEEGKELEVVWGTPGTPQKRVRVKVAKFPYADVVRNEDRDVAEIPTFVK